jgi:hypothetical protein
VYDPEEISVLFQRFSAHFRAPGDFSLRLNHTETNKESKFVDSNCHLYGLDKLLSYNSIIEKMDNFC